MELHHETVQYLKTKAKGKLVMTPKQLADEIPVSVNQQYEKRKKKTFPIPHKNIGRNVYYSIFHIADFLLTGEVSKAEVKTEQKPVLKREKATATTANLSHLFLLKSFVSHIQSEAEALTNLAESLLAYEKSLELKNKLEIELKK